MTYFLLRSVYLFLGGTKQGQECGLVINYITGAAYLAGPVCQKCQTISHTASHMHEWEVGTLLQNQ